MNPQDLSIMDPEHYSVNVDLCKQTKMSLEIGASGWLGCIFYSVAS
jgi:hypothetical protein